MEEILIFTIVTGFIGVTLSIDLWNKGRLNDTDEIEDMIADSH